LLLRSEARNEVEHGSAMLAYLTQVGAVHDGTRGGIRWPPTGTDGVIDERKNYWRRPHFTMKGRDFGKALPRMIEAVVDEGKKELPATLALFSESTLQSPDSRLYASAYWEFGAFPFSLEDPEALNLAQDLEAEYHNAVQAPKNAASPGAILRALVEKYARAQDHAGLTGLANTIRFGKLITHAAINHHHRQALGELRTNSALLGLLEECSGIHGLFYELDPVFGREAWQFGESSKGKARIALPEMVGAARDVLGRPWLDGLMAAYAAKDATKIEAHKRQFRDFLALIAATRQLDYARPPPKKQKTQNPDEGQVDDSVVPVEPDSLCDGEVYGLGDGAVYWEGWRARDPIADIDRQSLWALAEKTLGSGRLWEVIYLVHFLSYSKTDAAAEMGVSKARVSQLYPAAVQALAQEPRLRNLLEL
jgi:DNA-directed RNA polymerase specialized sigma24 family protein